KAGAGQDGDGGAQVVERDVVGAGAGIARQRHERAPVDVKRVPAAAAEQGDRELHVERLVVDDGCRHAADPAEGDAGDDRRGVVDDPAGRVGGVVEDQLREARRVLDVDVAEDALHAVGRVADRNDVAAAGAVQEQAGAGGEDRDDVRGGAGGEIDDVGVVVL